MRAILGAPTPVTQEEVVDGKVATWSYGESRSIRFNAQGKAAQRAAEPTLDASTMA